MLFRADTSSKSCSAFGAQGERPFHCRWYLVPGAITCATVAGPATPPAPSSQCYRLRGHSPRRSGMLWGTQTPEPPSPQQRLLYLRCLGHGCRSRRHQPHPRSII
ncbi:hypothetical protein NDU88_007350 [Pleurodeles waltl]|uniref:Uncharacterized protein n=1 Tax=Pleurodeles waltl TaxID=8319 RepID=A0AAV7VU62_PLEWA|nr:hypothetical protein NDU88_007350 [Pleurodeles waltl]